MIVFVGCFCACLQGECQCILRVHLMAAVS